MQLWILCLLFGVIHLIATLSYGIRIAGARTGRLAFCLSLFGTIVTLLFAAVDPYLPYLTDTTTNAETTHHELRSCVAAMAATRLLGTVLAHLGLIPGAAMIAAVARWIPT